jgi:hypothetical protein
MPAVQVATPEERPQPGDRTQIARVVREEYGTRTLQLTLGGMAGTEMNLKVLVQEPGLKLHATGAELAPPEPSQKPSSDLSAQGLSVHFPSGAGWQTAEVELSW